MARYFLEVAYDGSAYAGFQIQENANTIQAELEMAMGVYFKTNIELTGSSRTDAGVHAHQNFFHIDTNINLTDPKATYGINAILPGDIVLKNVKQVYSNAHSRFNALHRTYHYKIYTYKNPFLNKHAYYFPYALNVNILQQTAQAVLGNHDFASFSKKHTQVNNTVCNIIESSWLIEPQQYTYIVSANRFLRGMVRALVATMLKTASGNISYEQFIQILEGKQVASAYFNAPAQGLFLHTVHFEDTIFI
jgi:tRNA pseudouridine38-40 synthase